MEKGELIIKIIDWTLLIILLIAIIYAQIQGKYTNVEIKTIETCNGIPTNPENQQRINEITGMKNWSINTNYTKN